MLGIIFGVQQCRKLAITRGDLEARADSMSYWRDQAGTEHAKVGQLVTSQAFVQKSLDSLKTIKGAVVTATTTIKQRGEEILRADGYIYYEMRIGDTIVPRGRNKADTGTYTITAADTLEWLRNTSRRYTSPWDTIVVTFDSAILHVHDNLHIVESQVKLGGLFNRRIVPYVDVYHDNPALRTADVKAWRVTVPVKHWAIGPSVNFYPRFDNGIKFGKSFGVSLVYKAITF